MSIKNKIQELQQQLDKENDFSKRLEISGQIHQFKMELEGVSPESSEIECVGCGS